jgi:hypothetical protein
MVVSSFNQEMFENLKGVKYLTFRYFAPEVPLRLSNDRGDGRGEGVDATLLSYTLRYINLADLGIICQVGLPMHLCIRVNEEREREGVSTLFLSRQRQVA